MSEGDVTIELNGEPRRLAASEATIAGAVRALGADPEARGLAVAVDGEVVPRGRWESLGLAGGERVEVVAAVQGG